MNEMEKMTPIPSSSMELNQVTQPEDNPLTLQRVCTLADLIEKDAMAQIVAVPQNMRALGELITPVMGLCRICNRCGGKIYAGVRVDTGGNRSVVFRQEYQDGGFSPEFVIAQEELLTVAFYKNSGIAELEKDAKKAIKIIFKEYFSRTDNTEILNLLEVVGALAEALKELPIIEQEAEMSTVELYAIVVEMLKDRGILELLREENRGYLILGDNEVCALAIELQMPKNEALKLLKAKSLLYLTASCRGYKCKVQIGRKPDGTIEYDWAYCVYDLEMLQKFKRGERAETNIRVVNNTDF